MCLSIPAQVIKIEGQMADVSVGGAIFKAGLHMVEDVIRETIFCFMQALQFRRYRKKRPSRHLSLLKEMEDAENQ